MNNKENPIAQNRAEEFGYDLWEDFVIPPFYDSLDLISAKKPRVITGGRGCGKTSLLRYLCHQSQFSTKRADITAADFTHIGIYWKIDTQFAKILAKRNVEDDLWMKAFEHMAVLLMCQEILKSLESISNSSFQEFAPSDLAKFDFKILNSFNPAVPSDFVSLKTFLRREFNQFQTWVGSIRSLAQPVFLPKNFAIELLTEIKAQNALFKETNYFVYIDEYENLLVEQQRLINTWLKHSEMPLVFNLAMKRNSFLDKQTVGNEHLADIHDFREYDLESYYSDIVSFDLYAAEILFLRLWKNDGSTKIPLVPSELRSTDSEILNKRRSDTYRKKVIDAAKEFLPSPTMEEVAIEVFKDDTLLKRLTKIIENALKIKNAEKQIGEFLVSDFPQAGIVVPALLNRDIPLPELLNEINSLRAGKDNKFTGKTAWIHNNIVGCLLVIYEPLGRFCPFYSGFESFCLMSKTNLRHFLELCNKSVINETLNSSQRKINSISPKFQAEAAKQASTSFLKEIKSFGHNGNALHTFVLRLGTYFKYAHKRPAQSEPEQNHFSVKGNLPQNIEGFLSDAVKWSVLYESSITKQKGGNAKIESEDFEYILNPIYAPYFHISFRKKRRIDFSIEEITTLISGDFNQFEGFLKETLKEWKFPTKEDDFNLFTQPN